MSQHSDFQTDLIREMTVAGCLPAGRDPKSLASLIIGLAEEDVLERAVALLFGCSPKKLTRQTLPHRLAQELQIRGGSTRTILQSMAVAHRWVTDPFQEQCAGNLALAFEIYPGEWLVFPGRDFWRGLGCSTPILAPYSAV